METKPVFDSFLTDLKTAFPEIELSEYSVDDEVKYLETNYYPCVMQILQRDETFFNQERLFCKVDISKLWNENESVRESIWKHLQMCMFSSFLHGDIKEKISSVVGIFKNIWSSSGQTNDEIGKILNDENAEDHFKEILEYLQNTRLAKIFNEIVENFDINELDLNFENPQEVVEILRNPEHPTIKKLINKIQGILQEKMQRGEFTQQQLLGEIEGIKLKVQGIFGNVFNEMLGGHRAELPSSVLIGNSPEARRQRMLARLQKKQRDKK